MSYQHTVIRCRLRAVVKGGFEVAPIHAPDANVRVHGADGNQLLVVGEFDAVVTTVRELASVLVPYGVIYLPSEGVVERVHAHGHSRANATSSAFNAKAVSVLPDLLDFTPDVSSTGSR